MNMLSDYWNSIPAPEEHSGADTVAKLCDRVASSTLLEDRRDSVRALKAMAQDYQLEIGTQGMDVLMVVLQNDRSDVEIVRYALETLACVFQPDDATKGDDQQSSTPKDDSSDLGIGFTEIFVKKSEYVSCLLSLLEEYDFYVRFQCVQVLLLLLTNCPDKLQECVLADPRGVSRLMDLLTESREILRNEALLLLIQLTTSNPNVQKIVVFENAFDRLLDIVRDEGNSEGGIVVQDCLHLIHNLLRKNISNQNYFRETGNLVRLNPFLALQGAPPGLAIPGMENEAPKAENDWEEQKITNMLMMIELVRILVTPNNPNAPTNQKAMLKQNTTETLYTLTLMEGKLPPRVQVQVRCAVGEAMRGCAPAQQLFSGTTAKCGARPRPALVTLVVELLAFRNPFDYRCASLYCLESFLFNNSDGQMFLTGTLKQPPNANLSQATDTPLAAGAQILSALADTTDGISHWCACLALSSTIRGNSQAKQMALNTRVKLGGGTEPSTQANTIPLLELCLRAFHCNGMQKTRVSVSEYIFLCSFLSESPTNIAAYLSNQENLTNLIAHCQEVPRAGSANGTSVLIPGLASLLLGICLQWTDAGAENSASSRLSLLQVIHHVIGVDKYSENIKMLIQSDFFEGAQSSHQLRSGKPDETWFDYPFTVLVKSVKEKVMATITMPPQEAAALGAAPAPSAGSAEVKKLKQTIDAQHREITMLKQQAAATPQFRGSGGGTMSMASLSEIENLKTENAQLRKLVQQLEASVRGSRVEVEDLILLLAFEDEHNTALSQQITDLGHTPVPPPRDSTSEDSVPKPTPTPTLNGSATEEAQAYNTDANAIQSVGSYADVNTSMASQSTGSVSGTSSRDELRGLEAPVAETVSKSLPNSIPNLSEGTRDSVSSTHDTTHMRTPSLPMTQPYSQQPPSSMPQQIYQDQTQITGPAPPQAQTQPTQPPPQRQAPGPVFNGLDRSEHSGQNSYQYDSTAPYSHPPAGATNSTLAQPYGANTGAPPNNGQPTQYRPPTLFTGSQEQFGSGERQTFSLR